MSEEQMHGADGIAAFKRARRPAIKLSRETMVASRHLESGTPLPLVYSPAVEHVNLAAWIAEHRADIEATLLREGGLLFRGFGLREVTQFAEVVRAVSRDVIEYGERSSPRTRIGQGVYTSTEHPSSEFILLHNEQSYTLNWPMKIFFFCVQPAQRGGRTPLADSRRILRRLSPQLVERFRAKQVMYVRNYGDGLGLSWREAFQTNDRADVEAHCRRAAITCVWRSADQLRTHQVRPALREHPVTGETLWFNHMAFFHFSSLPEAVRASILVVVDEQDVAFNTFYGDGMPIEPDVVAEVRAAYRDEMVSFEWQPGDLLMLDNMLTAHGREPFEGPRSVAVAMAEPVEGVTDDQHSAPRTVA